MASRAFTLVSSSPYSSALKMEAVCSPETSVDFQRTTRRYIPEDNALVCLLVSLTALSVACAVWRSVAGWSARNELERVLKEEIVT
jgi:hypothetical protein